MAEAVEIGGERRWARVVDEVTTTFAGEGTPFSPAKCLFTNYGGVYLLVSASPTNLRETFERAPNVLENKNKKLTGIKYKNKV
ncbi:hypothetical protein QYF36_018356 [Acer negundo]|nr:hypothetical protein QYF36_018356 [Acer negundo]